MARARTKGDPIQIRLSRHHDELLRLNAEQAGLPAAQLATEMLERLLDPPKPVTAARGAHSETCKCPVCVPPKASTR